YAAVRTCPVCNHVCDASGPDPDRHSHDARDPGSTATDGPRPVARSARPVADDSLAAGSGSQPGLRSTRFPRRPDPRRRPVAADQPDQLGPVSRHRLEQPPLKASAFEIVETKNARSQLRPGIRTALRSVFVLSLLLPLARRFRLARRRLLLIVLLDRR